MEPDKQIVAIQKIVDALDSLEDEGDLGVVLGFINLRYGPNHLSSSIALQSSHALVGSTTPSNSNLPISGSFPDFYHSTNPQTDGEKALVSGYWIQKCNGAESFDSFSVNQQLKDMGYPIGNITRAFDWLMSQKPQLVHQVKKSGSTKQARKLFKVTQAGLTHVEKMAASNSVS